MALFPIEYLKSIVSIREITGVEDEQLKTNSVATGFLVGYQIGKKDDEGKSLYKVFLVTNKHVFEHGDGSPISKMVLRFNTVSGKGHPVQVNLIENGKRIWLSHSDTEVDLAVLPLNTKVMDKLEIDYKFIADDELVEAKDFEEKNISAGDRIFVLGFPMGIDGDLKNAAITRMGILSRVDEEVLNQNYFFIDAAAYPGNSGGPVIHKPEMLAIEGTSSNLKAVILGVVSSGITYSETAVSPQTGEVRVTFRERTGLTKVVPLERLIEIMKVSVKDTYGKESNVKEVVEVE